MRTTLILEDVIAKKAKKRALDAGITFSEITNRALRDYLLSMAPPGGEPERSIVLPTYRGEGPSVDLTPARIAELGDCDW